MNKREAYKLGHQRGWNIASWQDMPEIGETLPRHIDWVGVGTIETVEDQIEAFEMICSEAESNDRCYTPFEFTAKEINDHGERADELWEQFDNGIWNGVHAYRRKHFPLKKMRRDAKQHEREMAD